MKKKTSHFVYRIIDRKTGEACGSYSRASHDEVDFSSASEARGANCHGMFEDQDKYAVGKYKVTYELINPEVKTPNKIPRPKPSDWLMDALIKDMFGLK